jgi:hypothetical protein
MNCIRCGRALNRAALTIPSKTGPLSWGPKCAKTVEQIPTRTRYPVVRQAPAVAAEVDPKQMALELTA